MSQQESKNSAQPESDIAQAIVEGLRNSKEPKSSVDPAMKEKIDTEDRELAKGN